MVGCTRIVEAGRADITLNVMDATDQSRRVNAIRRKQKLLIMANRKNNKNQQRGFTLIEVIAVLVIIAVLAAVAVSRISSTQDVAAMTEAEILKMHLRYAQMRALSDDTSWGISCSGKTYTLLRDGKTDMLLEDESTVPIKLPGEDSAMFESKNDITFNCGTITFDDWGSPGTGASFEVTPGGGTITVTANTGFIP